MLTIRVFVIYILLAILPLASVLACYSCGDRCDKCEYGHTYSKTCEFKVCYKAPGEVCGAIDMKDRLCAEGLYCKNNRCQGCSLSPFKCYVESF